MCWHKYTKWGKPFNSQTKRGYGQFGQTELVDVIMEARVCTKCRHVDVRYVCDGKIQEGEATLPQSIASCIKEHHKG